jgi:hypothetical protein
MLGEAGPEAVRSDEFIIVTNDRPRLANKNFTVTQSYDPFGGYLPPHQELDQL